MCVCVCMGVCVSLSLSMRVYGLSRGLMRPFTYSLSHTRTTLTQTHKVGVRERVYEHLYTRERGISSDVVCVCVCVCERVYTSMCSESRQTYETGLYTSLYSRYTHSSLPRVDRHTKLVSVRE